MRISTGTLMTLVLTVLTAASVMLTLQNYQRAAHQLASPETAEIPRYVLHDAQWTRLNAQGVPDYVADAQSIEYFDDHHAELTAPRVHAFGGGGSPWNMQAPAGSTLPHSRSLALTGGVTVDGHWPDGEALTIVADHLWVDQAQHVLRTDTQVRADSPSRTITARGLIADADGKRIQLLNQVQGRYAPHS